MFTGGSRRKEARSPGRTVKLGCGSERARLFSMATAKAPACLSAGQLVPVPGRGGRIGVVGLETLVDPWCRASL